MLAGIAWFMEVVCCIRVPYVWNGWIGIGEGMVEVKFYFYPAESKGVDIIIHCKL